MKVLGRYHDSTRIHDTAQSQYWYHINDHMAGPTIMTVLKSIIVVLDKV